MAAIKYLVGQFGKFLRNYLRIKKSKKIIQENLSARQQIKFFFNKNKDNWLKKILKKII